VEASKPSKTKFNSGVKKVDSKMTDIAHGEGPVSHGGQAQEESLNPRFSIPVKQILVPTDLTEESQNAVDCGVALAQRFGAHMTLLHVYREPYSLDYLRGSQACAAVLKHRRDSEAALTLLAEKVKERHVDCDAEVRDSVLCEDIVNMANQREIDLIVISTHHYNWVARLAYGCDAEQILRHAPCPILIVQNSCTKAR
jgi:nucleotide-binding universal stress UspA family protein